MIEIWTEKYRPKKLADVKGQNDIIARLGAFVANKNMPHILFAGPAGVGKTTAALAIAHELYGETWRDNILELNASDARGIDVIRGAVKDFARTRAVEDVPFKIIYLDECLDGESIVTIKNSPEQTRIKLKNLVESKTTSNVKVESIDEQGRTNYVKINKFIKIPHNPDNGFYELELHDGKTLRATGNHLLLTPKGWIEVKSLRQGDLILAKLDKSLENKICLNSKIIDVKFKVLNPPRLIRKVERYFDRAPEIKIIETLAKYPNGLTNVELFRLSRVSPTQISMICSSLSDKYYTSLHKLEIVGKVGDKKPIFKLLMPKNEAIVLFKQTRREANRSNARYIRQKLKELKLWPIESDTASILARLLGHIFGDGCLSLKQRQVFFSGKEEDMQKIKVDLAKLGFRSSAIRHTYWKKGQCWSFASFDIRLLNLVYMLGAPVGKKTNALYFVPDWVINGNKDIKKEFLAAFFGSEGCKPMFQGRTIKPIYLSQSKREDLAKNLESFLLQIIQLLNGFGIKTKLKMNSCVTIIRKDGTKTVKGTICITNKFTNIINFLSQIGYLYCEYKSELATKALKYLIWRSALKKAAYSFRPIPHFDKWLKELFLGDFAYHYVTEIKPLQNPRLVYCLTTENGKFVSNGIVAHNCDALTKEAQDALRRIMEDYVQTTRFILSCNYSSKVIPPIQSRCAIFRFKPLPKETIEEILLKVAQNEGFKIEPKARELIYEASEGDMRKAHNLMQACAATLKRDSEENVISLKNISQIISFAEPKEVEAVVKLALEGRFLDAKKKLTDVMVAHGLSGIDIIKQIQKEVWDLKLDEKVKIELISICGEIEFRMVEGANEFIQLASLLAEFAAIGGKIK